MKEGVSKRREWVKNAAIIFLVIMLFLTFFSNTIMNYSLPEVATAYIQPGTITAKVRGTGNVEATDPYKVVAKESRVISSVAVKQGDEVKKDDVLYYLEDAESEELLKAESELKTMELEYLLALFNGDVTNNTINKVKSGKTDNFNSYQTQITGSQSNVRAAEDNVAAQQALVDNLTKQLDILKNNQTQDTTAEKNAINKAKEDSTNASNASSQADTRLANLQGERAAVAEEIARLESIVGSADLSDLTRKRDIAKTNLEAAGNDLVAKINNILGTSSSGTPLGLNESLAEAGSMAMLNNLTNNLDVDADKTTYKQVSDAYYEAKKKLTEAELALSQFQSYHKARGRLAELDKEIASAREDKSNAANNASKAQSAITSAEQILSDKEKNQPNLNNQQAVNNKLIEANANLAAAKLQLERVQKDQKALITDLQAELNLDNKTDLIALKEEEIARLKAKSMGAAIKSPVDGVITTLAHTAGESTKPEEEVAVIQVAGKGFTVSFSVTNEQAAKVKVGDTGELQNAWYYQETQVILTSIRPDPDNPGQKKQLTFTLSGGEIQTGQALNISVGQRSENYELTVPNSAVREDANGKFVLIVEPKNSPLGNRYFATRVDVEALASDDTNTAISGGLYGNEYAITTATKPVTAGKQVRFNE